VGSSTHAYQTAQIMQSFETICESENPDIVVVVGDVNSTLAAALVVSKMNNIKLAHVEAGGRSFDRTMPEEINRIVTDVLSDYLFAIEPSHVDNLAKEGVDKSKIFLVGDTIIDNLFYNLDKIDTSNKDNYVLITVHRQSNTDDRQRLYNILSALDILSRKLELRFSIHPRTNRKIDEFGLHHLLKNIKCYPPLSYLDFLEQMVNSSLLITDSGGITIESAVLGVPCITLRDSIERWFTVEEGTNVLVDDSTELIVTETYKALDKGKVKLSEKLENLLDGKASERIISILEDEKCV